MSLDLALEHLNQDFKDNVRGITLISLRGVLPKLHMQLYVLHSSSASSTAMQVCVYSNYHYVPSHEKDRGIILGQLLRRAAFRARHHREYAHSRELTAILFLKSGKNTIGQTFESGWTV